MVAAVTETEARYLEFSDEELRNETIQLRERVQGGESLEDVLVEAFALVRVASQRTTGLRHYEVQLMGGNLMHRGEVIEMRTGEGKTLVATLPLFLNALAGRGVHLVTVNDYLVRRDGGWMGKIFHFLGLTVACIGSQQFSALYDPDYVNPGAELEDERLVHWRPCERAEAYAADITYGTASEFGFDYLRDNRVRDPELLVQRDLYFAIIDEVDNVLIDDAKTPLIISGNAARTGKDYARFAQYVRGLRRNTVEDEDAEPNGHYDLDEKSRSISLTDIGIEEIEKRIEEINLDAGDSLYDPTFYHLTYYLDNALRAEYLFKRDVQYVVQGQEVIIVDDSTGRLMPGRRYSDGLHEAIEAKEGVQVKRESVTIATITLQNYFRMYEKLAGMTGTAMTDSEEFFEIYKLPVTPLPTNVEYIVESDNWNLEERKEKVENGQHIFWVKPNEDAPVFHKRIDFPDQVYTTSDAKDEAIIDEILRVRELGRPVLVGTTSVEHSELISNFLKRRRVQHTVLNAKMHQSEALVVAQAGRPGAVTISTNMAGRGTDILLGGNPEGMSAEALEKEMFDRRMLDELAMALVQSGQAAAEDLARKNSKLTLDLIPALIEVKAEFDAALVEIEELQVLGYLARKLQKQYGLDFSEVREALRLIREGNLQGARLFLDAHGHDVAFVEDASRQLNLYQRYVAAQSEPRKIAQFISGELFELNYNGRAALIRALANEDEAQARQVIEQVPGLEMAQLERVKGLFIETQEVSHEVRRAGGLHVVGSERHESRRIDNQLRGRAARQGDPGSSRFFLSFEDELMLRFGGERLKRFTNSNILPDDVPIDFAMVGRIIESAQERIEGYNFDIRKNVVEYDDVMDKQRKAIYAERKQIVMGDTEALDRKVEQAFAQNIGELVHNYRENYVAFIRGEVERAVMQFTTDATDEVLLPAVLRRLRGYLPTIGELDPDELVELRPDRLIDRLARLAHENLEDGTNLYQLLRATSRFIPLMPSVPNIAVQLANRRSGHLQAKENIKLEFVTGVRAVFDNFLSSFAEEADLETIWAEARAQIDRAFAEFNAERQSSEGLRRQQEQFRQTVSAALNDLLQDSLSALPSDSLVEALQSYAASERAVWRERMGEDKYQRVQRLILLTAIDREWQDYLTAMDDLRREIRLESVAQRDPKVEYKRRSFQMFQNMRANIDEAVAQRYFVDLQNHQAVLAREETFAAAREQLSQAGYQVVQRQNGKGVELRRDAPKVGRNDPCPCGSGKKYKHCHMKQDQAARRGRTAVAAGQGRRSGGKKKRRRK